MSQPTPQLDPNILRQGDVLLVRVGDTKKRIRPAAKPVVLAYGEVTGHTHQFLAESRVSFLGNTQLAVGRPAILRHEEHGAPTVPPGLYDLPVQVEHQDEDEPLPVQD